MTKRGSRSKPKFVKLSCSDFLSAYSSGKFLCIILFNVTLENPSDHDVIQREKKEYSFLHTLATKLHAFVTNLRKYELLTDLYSITGIFCTGNNTRIERVLQNRSLRSN